MNRTTGFIFSVTLNVILLGVVAFLFVDRTKPDLLPPTPREGTRPSAKLPEAVVSRVPSRGETENVDAPVAALPVAGGLQLSADFAQTIKRLQADGISDDLLAQMVASELTRQWTDNNRELQRKFRTGEIDQRDLQRAYLGWETTREEALKSLLGDEAFKRWDKKKVLAQIDPDALHLTAAETDAAYELMKDWERRGRDLRRASQDGELDPTDYHQQYQNAQKDYETQLAQLLGAERFGAYKQGSTAAWNSPVRTLRQLNLNPGDIDVLSRADQQLSGLQQQLQQQMQSGQVKGNDYQEQLRAATAARDQEYQRVLGAQRYDEFKKLQDYSYQQMTTYAKAWQLSPSDIDRIYQSVQDYRRAVQDYQKQAQAAVANQAVDQAQMNQWIADYTKQTEAQLRSYLGDDRFTKLQRSGAIMLNAQPGQWNSTGYWASPGASVSVQVR